MKITTQTKPDFIWKLTDMLDFLKHPSENVREWAASHILELYPEAVNDVVTFIPEASERVVSELIEGLKDTPFPESEVDTLLNFFKSESRPYPKAVAAALLLRNGFSISEDDKSEVKIGDTYEFLPETEQGFEYLLGSYRGEEDVDESLTYSIAYGCGVGDLIDILEESHGKGRRQVVKPLEKFWRTKLPPIHKIVKEDEARQLLSETLDTVEEDDGPAERFAPSLVSEMTNHRSRIVALLEASEGRKANGLEPPEEETELLLACVLALHRDAACVRGLSGQSSLNELWQILSIRPWQSHLVDQGLTDFLNGQKPESVFASLRQTLSSKHGRFEYAFLTLAAARIPGHASFRQNALDGRYGQLARGDCVESEELISQNTAAIDALIEEWQDNPPSATHLFLLRAYPTEQTVRFLLDKFEHYMSKPSSSDFVELVREIAHPDFLPLLVEEWREGEPIIAGAVHILAEINSVEPDDTILRIIEEDEENEQRVHDLIQDDSGEKMAERLRSNTVPVPLRCTNCSRTYQYDVKKIFVGKNPDAAIIAQVIECKGCGGLETYETTEETQRAISLEMMKAFTLDTQTDGDWREYSPLKFGPSVLSAGGKTFNKRPDAYRHLLALAENDPQNAELRRRLGNLMSHGLRPDLAIPHYEESIRLDPRDIESVASLAQAFIDEERYQEAIPSLESLVSLCKDTELDEDLCEEMFGALLHFSMMVQNETGHQIKIFDAPQDMPDIDASAEDAPIELLSFDLDDPDDFETAFQTFRYGVVPERALERNRPRPEFDSPLSLRTPTEPIRKERKIGRNEACPCGSGKKYKRCCGR